MSFVGGRSEQGEKTQNCRSPRLPFWNYVLHRSSFDECYCRSDLCASSIFRWFVQLSRYLSAVPFSARKVIHSQHSSCAFSARDRWLSKRSRTRRRGIKVGGFVVLLWLCLAVLLFEALVFSTRTILTLCDSLFRDAPNISPFEKMSPRGDRKHLLSHPADKSVGSCCCCCCWFRCFS